MRIATWNLNSVKARQDHLLSWLAHAKPDVLCLQELKAQADAFPAEAIKALGYEAAVYGQKSYNGVAVLSNVMPDTVQLGFEEKDGDTQARLIHVTFGALHVISAYFPNGNEVGSEKFQYKLAWIKRLAQLLPARFNLKKDFVVLAGDFNVSPRDIDAAFPKQWSNTVLACEPVRKALTEIRDVGMLDAVEPFFPQGGPYTWWDYRAGALERNDGLRIDHVYVSEALRPWVRGACVVRAEREKEKPSDHVPVVVDLDIEWKYDPFANAVTRAPKPEKKQLGLEL